MKTVNIGDKEVTISTNLNEVSVSQFDKCIKVFTDVYDNEFDRYVHVVEAISTLSTDEIEDMDIDDFKGLIKSIELNDISKIKSDFINEVEVDGIKYKSTANGNLFNFKVKEIFKIEERIKSHPTEYVAYTSAVLFKETDEEGNIIGKLTDEAINARLDKFSNNIMANVLAPYINKLSKYFASVNAR